MSPRIPTRDAPPIVILGAGGMLGTAWARLLSSLDRPAVLLGRPAFDLSSPGTLEGIGPASAVINCAGYTRVDDAEANEPDARLANAIGPGALARLCATRGVPLVHYSTDYVFDGAGQRPYPPDAPTGPINAYGRTKLEGEQLVQAAGGRSLIIRTSWLYAAWGSNFVRTIAARATVTSSLRVVHDQKGRPTCASHLAAATLRLLEMDASGTFHVTDGGMCSWFEFAREIVRQTQAPCPVEPCSTTEFPRPAKRPANSVLGLEQTEALLGPMPDWTDNLRKTTAALRAAAPGGAPS